MERGEPTMGDEMTVPTSGGGSGRILVCDDTEQIRQLIRVNLELEGYEVVEAGDGQEALEILLDTSQPLPHVVTLDSLMPRRDGWWTVSMIRTDPRPEHIPIVMVTASVQSHDREQAQRASLDGFVAKPFDPEELVAVIAALVAGRRDRDGSEPAHPRP
jgi:CheY-like chemotaxis protein